MGKSKRNKLRIPVNILITKNEIEIIKGLKNYRYEKILFTMLVLAKYFKFTNTSVEKKKSHSENINKYFLNKKFNSILKYAHTSQKKNENIKHYLIENKLIEQTYNGKAFKILFTDMNDCSEEVICITDIDNLIDFYPPYCEDCGKILEKKYKHNKCLSCYQEYRKNIIRDNKNNWNWN
jgi:hypothetical protein